MKRKVVKVLHFRRLVVLGLAHLLLTASTGCASSTPPPTSAVWDVSSWDGADWN